MNDPNAIVRGSTLTRGQTCALGYAYLLQALSTPLGHGPWKPDNGHPQGYTHRPKWFTAGWMIANAAACFETVELGTIQRYR